VIALRRPDTGQRHPEASAIGTDQAGGSAVPARPAPSIGGTRLVEKFRQAIRVRHMSVRTEHAYVGWIRRFILFHDKRHLLLYFTAAS
jgi:hypothetical protein